MQASKACTSSSLQEEALQSCSFAREERIQVGPGLGSLHVEAVAGVNGNFCAR